MKRSFIVLSWHDGIGRDRAHRVHLLQGSDLEQVADGPDYVVLARRGILHGSRQPGLLVLGTLYGGTASHRASNAVDRLRALVAANWGAYMAFAADGSGVRYAMVDPSGAGRAHLAADRHLTMVTDLLDRNCSPGWRVRS